MTAIHKLRIPSLALTLFAAAGCAISPGDADAPEPASGGVTRAPSASHEAPAALSATARIQAAPPGLGDIKTLSDEDLPTTVKKMSSQGQALYGYAATVASVIPYVSTAISIFEGLDSLLNGGGPSAEDLIFSQLQSIKAELDQLHADFATLDFRMTELGITSPMADLASAAKYARAGTRPGAPYVPDPAELRQTYADVLQVNSPVYFTRTNIDSVNDGEWKLVTSYRPTSGGGMIDDYRVGLPALMAAIGYRLTILAAVDPNFAKQSFYRDELAGYATKLKSVRDLITSNVKCGWGVSATTKQTLFGNWAADDPDFKLDALCADALTGANVTQSVHGVISGFMPPSVGWFDYRGNWTYSSATGGWDHAGWSPDGREMVSMPVNSTNVTVYRQYPYWTTLKVVDEFWRLSVTSAPFNSFENYATLDDQLQGLKINLGLFEVQRMIDALDLMVNSVATPMPSTKVTIGTTGGCISSGTGGMTSLPYVAACNSGDPLQQWTYNSATGQIKSSSGYCLDVQNGSSRNQTPVWLYYCWPTTDRRIIAQRWTWGVEGHLRNAVGRSLSTVNGEVWPGTSLWIENDSDHPNELIDASIQGHDGYALTTNASARATAAPPVHAATQTWSLKPFWTIVGGGIGGLGSL